MVGKYTFLLLSLFIKYATRMDFFYPVLIKTLLLPVKIRSQLKHFVVHKILQCRGSSHSVTKKNIYIYTIYSCKYKKNYKNVILISVSLNLSEN